MPKSLKGADVVHKLTRACLVEGCHPEKIQCDSRSEFESKDVHRRADENQVTLDFSRAGKPTDTKYVESFIGKFRGECLSLNWFLSLDDARHKIENFKWEYNHYRRHSALNDLTPKEFVNLQLTKNKIILKNLRKWTFHRNVAKQCHSYSHHYTTRLIL